MISESRFQYTPILLVVMKFTFNWLKEFVSFEASPEKLAELLTMAGLEVESVTPLQEPEDQPRRLAVRGRGDTQSRRLPRHRRARQRSFRADRRAADVGFLGAALKNGHVAGRADVQRGTEKVNIEIADRQSLSALLGCHCQ